MLEKNENESASHSVVSDSLQTYGLQPTKHICSWNFPRKILEWVAIPSSGNLPNPGIESTSPVFQINYLPFEPPG